MRIISGFKDYYDCMQRLDEDKTTMWVREQNRVELASPPQRLFYTGNPRVEAVDLGKKPWPFPRLWGTGYYDRFERFTYYLHIVGFCGKIYPVVEFYGSKQYMEQSYSTFCHSAEDVHAFMKAHLSSREWNNYTDEKKIKRQMKDVQRGNTFWWSTERTKFTFDYVFEECLTKQTSFIKIFEDAKTPVFIATSGGGMGRRYDYSINYNACLREVEFFKTFDPAHAYQEIQTYLYNQAVPMKPIPEMSDQIKAESKGFDKFSFRKDPIRKKHRK